MSLPYLLYLRLNSTCVSVLFCLLWKWCDFSLHKAKFLIWRWSFFQIKQSKNEFSPCAPFGTPNTLMFLGLIWFFTSSYICHRVSYSSNWRYWKHRDIILFTVPQLLLFTAAYFTLPDLALYCSFIRAFITLLSAVIGKKLWFLAIIS